MDPDAYRSSLQHLSETVRPRHLYLGHPYRRADGTPYGVELDAGQSREALEGSLAVEARVRDAACGCLQAGLQDTASPYSPFAPAAKELQYDGDPHPGAVPVLHHPPRLPHHFDPQTYR
jgi:hydroxyacylglutathione hydrolase